METCVQIHIDEKYSIITLKFTNSSIDTFTLQETCRKVIKVVGEVSKDGHLLTGLICDCSNISPMSLDLIHSYFMREFSKIQRTGLGMLNFVVPKNIEAVYSINKLTEVSIYPITTSYSYKKALQIIKDEMMSKDNKDFTKVDYLR